MSNRSDLLLSACETRVLVLDGAMGTALQGFPLSPDDFGGASYEGCNEILNLTRPQLIEQVHQEYLQAGCDIIETNTFGSTPLVLAEYNLADQAYEISRKGAEIARSACLKFDDPNQPRFVAGALGPTTKAISVTGGVTFQELIEHFYEQARGLMDGGVDYLLFETCQDARNIKAGLIATDQLFKEKGKSIPLAVSGTIESMGTLLAGQTVEALIAAFQNRDLLYLGLNCATGPEFMTDPIRSLADLSPFRVACVPNAGLPDEDGCYLETPSMMRKVLEHFLQENWLNFVGGCCGTHAEHVRAFAEMVKGRKPRPLPTKKRSLLSGLEHLEVTSEQRPVLVGERTNVIGSKKFKELISAEKFEEASEIARLQVKSGAQIIDICLANPDRDENDDLVRFMEKVIQKVKVPLMIDSTDEKVIETALTFCQGKSIINSINLEDGEERFEKIVPIAKKYGAAVVVGCIDEDPEQGMAVTAKRKLEVAKRSFDLLVNKYKIPPEDIYFDSLVFPCATGDAQYVGSAAETIRGVALIREALPQTKSVLGISNVSFGLPAAGREVLNSVFLYHCVQAGLDLAIVNSEKLERFSSIPQEEIDLADNLIFNRGSDPIAAFAAHFRGRIVKAPKQKRNEMPLDQRLSNCVIEGSKEGLIDDLKLALNESLPLEIINGPLMRGMDEVGKLFNANKLIVAEVLQSAEVMKAAVGYLEGFMEKDQSTSRGKMVLATVKGDVHDIGKNLVDIILSNNGYQVVNLGIKIPPETLIQAVRQHKPDMIGLSGLLVKSAQQMIATAEDLTRAEINIPILVGGAALSRAFTEKRILPAYNGMVLYAQDAMQGLDIANRVMEKTSNNDLQEEIKQIRLSRSAERKLLAEAALLPHTEISIPLRSPKVPNLTEFPAPPDFKRHIDRATPIEQIWKFINPMMLYTRHLGVKAAATKLMAKIKSDPGARIRLHEQDPRSLEIWEAVEEVKREYATKVLMPSAVYRFFSAQSVPGEDALLLFENSESSKPIGRFVFQRQKHGDFFCLTDYVGTESHGRDNVALFVTSVGRGVREESQRLREKGEFLKSHILQAVAIESAEGFAELMHSQLRMAWGFPDDPKMSMLDRFQAKYRGKRYSFGYPACPSLEDQRILFDLLKPEEIGVELTEGYMMDPEASVSAIVFHHPKAQYFGVANDLSPGS